MGSQVMCCTWREMGWPSKSVNCTPDGRDGGEIAVAEKEKVARVKEDRGHIAGDEVFVVTESDHRGRTIASGDDLVGLVGRDHGDGEHAGQLLHRLAYRFFQRLTIFARAEILLDQMSDDFGVGLGRELVAFGDQLLLQRDIVLDDAVVDDDDLAGAVAMGMSVLFRGTPMRRPAGVADAVGAVERLQADDLFQVAQLAFGAANLQASAIAGDRDAGRVVAAILQPPQAIDDDRHYPLLANVTNNSAHVWDSPERLNPSSYLLRCK